MLGISAKAGKVISGTDYCLQEMKKRKVKLIIIAEDSAERTKKNFTIETQKYQVNMQIWGTIEEISKAIGKQNRAVIGITDENLGRQIKKIISGGDVIG